MKIINLAVFVNLAQQAIETNTCHEAMMKRLREDITTCKLGSSRRINFFSDDSENGQTSPSIVQDFLSNFNFNSDPAINENVSLLALNNGFELHSILLHCPKHKRMDLFLREFFLSFLSPKDLFQGASNMINSDILKNHVNIDHLNQFCEQCSPSLV